MVRVSGSDIADLKVSDLAQRIGYIPQNAHQQIFCDSVAKEVGFALSMMGRPKDESDARVARAGLDGRRLGTRRLGRQPELELASAL